MKSQRPSKEMSYTKPSNITYFQPASPRSVKKQESVPSLIYIVGTGGTIAGTASSATSASYAPSKLNVAQLIETMPDIKKFDEEIQTVDLFHINSEDISAQDWLRMAKEVNNLLQLSDVKGVVITHGTDTLEETAYFLDLAIKSDKPVVLVGSMRASTSLSADGPLNLFNALSVVHSPDACGRGVMVMMNDTIYDGRDVTKCNTTQINTFDSRNSGSIGHVNFGKVEFEKRVTRKHTTETPFEISNLDDLPTVEIVYEYAGSKGAGLKSAIKRKPDGIVIAGVGDGNLPAPDRALLAHAKELGIRIIRSSRTGSGRVTADSNEPAYVNNDLIAGDNLNPQKARILLMLSLTLTRQVNEIRNNFSLY